jgi:DNA topoisomerase-1
LSQPKAARGGAARKEVLKVFGPSPVTEKPVQLLGGRYGPYVTDGVTNASLPRGTTVEEVTLEYALNLLKARAERGPSAAPSRRRRRVKSAAAGPTVKAAAKKRPTRTAKKKAPRKKTARKKTARKTVTPAEG